MDGINCYDFSKGKSSKNGVHQYNLDKASQQLWKIELQQLSEEKKHETYFGSSSTATTTTDTDTTSSTSTITTSTAEAAESVFTTTDLLEEIDFDEVSSIIEEKFTLNRKQKKVFQLIIGNTVKRLRGETVQQVIAYVGGAGGTGKSQVIKSVKEFFTLVKERHKLRLCAYTGSAAKLIGGATIHSLAMLRKLHTNKAPLEKIWGNVTTLLMDEVSMTGCRLFSRFSRNITVAKHAPPHLPFGGIDVILFGDFSQYPPVLDTPLYANYDGSEVKCSTKQSDIEKQLGISLWNQLTHIALLTEQMRITDPVYQEVLSRLREGTGTFKDYALLSTRVIGNGVDVPQSDNPIIVPGNELRHSINLHHIKKHASSTAEHVLVCESSDSTKHGHLTKDQEKATSGLYNTQTGGLSGKLPIFLGMPVYLTKNISTELGLTNGTKGVVRKIYLKDTDKNINMSSGCEFSVLKSQPECVIMEINEPVGKGLTNLQSCQFPVFPERSSFQIKLPMCKRLVSVNRTQLPLEPAYSCTGHKSQGQTLDRVAVDLVPQTGMKKINTSFAYVPLSRVRRLQDLVILRPFSYDLITKAPHPQLKKMMSDFKERDICKDL